VTTAPPPGPAPVAAGNVLSYERTMKMFVKRPALFGAVAFLLTVGIARLLSYLWPPLFHVRLSGVHIHHYVFGIFILTIAGFLALVFKGPRATLGIALLYGLGVGLTYDEFGFWINPPFVRGVRWDNGGLLIVGIAFVIVAVVTALVRGRRAERRGKSGLSGNRSWPDRTGR
jgi:hypothetical protein